MYVMSYSAQCPPLNTDVFLIKPLKQDESDK